MRAFFANGVDEMHVPWAVEGLPTLLHLSLFLFFVGLVIFLFGVDQEVFTGVVLWIAPFSMTYGLITLLPLIRQDSPYYTPLSMPAWYLYASIQFVTFKVLSFLTSGGCGSYQTWERFEDSKDRYRCWMLGGVETIAEETVSEKSSEVDVRILSWTISALGDDDSLEKFFESIPGLFNSKLVNLERDFPETLLMTFWSALDGFMGRTLSSNSITESVKSRRVNVCRDTMSMIPCSYLHRNLPSHFDQAPISIERLRALARWRAHQNDDVADYARVRVAKGLASIQERDDDWIALASDVSGLAPDDLRDDIAHGGDNVLFATLIDVSRQAIHSHEFGFVWELTQFDIRHTLLELQHDFCILWNEIVQEARNKETYMIPIDILRLIRPLYIALHQGTDAAPSSPTTSSSFTDPFNPLSYPLCNIPSHRSDSTAHLHTTNSHAASISTQPGNSPDTLPRHSTFGGSAVSRLVKEASIITGLPLSSDPTTPIEIGDSFQVPAATSLPDHINPHPTDTSPAGAIHKVAPCAGPDIGESLALTSTPAPTPALVPASTPPVLDKILASCDADTVSTPIPSLPALSVVGFSIPPSHVLPWNNTEFFVFGSTTPSRLTGNSTLPLLRARGLVNTGSMCFANAVLQLLVYSPLLWDLFRELGDLKEPHGTGGAETSGGTTPLLDATVRFFEEFMVKENEPLPTQQPPQQTTREREREDEGEKKEYYAVDSFEPTYVYNAMREKKQLEILLVCSCHILVPCH